MRKDKDFLLLAIVTVITAVGWVVFDAYHAYTVSTVSAALVKVADPIVPTLDASIIQKLKTRHEPVPFATAASSLKTGP